MIQENISLRDHSSFKIGGAAKYYLTVSSIEELMEGLKEWKQLSESFTDQDKRIFVLGGGTNLLVSDGGFSGLVIHNNIKFIEREGDRVTTGAGVKMAQLLNFCIENSLDGLQWAGGLPGTVGGAVRGNAGAFEGEAKDNVFAVQSLDFEALEIKSRNNGECKFGYRDSVFKSGEGANEIILSITFALQKGDRGEIRKVADDRINHRSSRHPLNYPNAGSTFKNVDVKDVPSSVLRELESHIKTDPFPVIPVATLLSMCNLKGKKIGGAQVSDIHPNFIINIDNAAAADVKNLIELEKEDVRQKFGIDLEVEVMFVE